MKITERERNIEIVNEIREEMRIKINGFNEEIKVLSLRLDELKKMQIKNDKNKNN